MGIEVRSVWQRRVPILSQQTGYTEIISSGDAAPRPGRFRKPRRIELPVGRVNLRPAMHHAGGPGIAGETVRAGGTVLIDLARADCVGNEVVGRTRGRVLEWK